MGIPFKVTYVAKIDKENSMGESNGAERRIKIQKGLDTSIEEATLMHEIIHSILYLTGQAEQLNEDQEEGLVLALEHGLSQIYERKK